MHFYYKKKKNLQSFEREQYTLGIFIDYSKAFDRINHTTLIKKLAHYGFRGIFLSLLQSCLDHRKQYVTINGFSSKFKRLQGGVPQGSILGPLLFNIYINDIVTIAENTKFIVYADDTSLFFSGQDLTWLTNTANSALAQLNNWSRINSLLINASKTKAVLFRRNNTAINADVRLILGTSFVELVPVVKSLGGLFHETMLWNERTALVITKLSRTVGILSRVSFLPQNIKLLIYNSLFHSTLTYAFLVWGNTTAVNLTKLHRLQKKAIRIVSASPYDAHTGPIFDELGLLPVHKLYQTILISRYHAGIKRNDRYLQELATLIPLNKTYTTRNKDTWKIPRTRTNYGCIMLMHILPSTLNSLGK